MIFWIVVIFAVITFLISSLCEKRAWVDAMAVSAITCGVCLVAVIIMLVCIIFEHAGTDGRVAQAYERYDALTYQYENNIYDNDNDLGKRELMVDIQNWNEDLAKYRENQDDLWVGIFTANIYDQFAFIEWEEE